MILYRPLINDELKPVLKGIRNINEMYGIVLSKIYYRDRSEIEEDELWLLEGSDKYAKIWSEDQNLLKYMKKDDIILYYKLSEFGNYLKVYSSLDIDYDKEDINYLRELLRDCPSKFIPVEYSLDTDTFWISVNISDYISKFEPEYGEKLVQIDKEFEHKNFYTPENKWFTGTKEELGKLVDDKSIIDLYERAINKFGKAAIKF